MGNMSSKKYSLIKDNNNKLDKVILNIIKNEYHVLILEKIGESHYNQGIYLKDISLNNIKIYYDAKNLRYVLYFSREEDYNNYNFFKMHSLNILFKA